MLVVVFIVLIGVLFFAISIFKDEKEYGMYRDRDLYEEAFEPILIDNVNTNIRGNILIKNHGYVSLDIKLISNPQNFKDWNSHQALISFSKTNYVPKLMDVPFPFYLSKKAKSNVIVVSKDTFKLYFLLDNLKE